ncbi:MAG: hypothetical protein AB8G15_08830 [Saprospiraceae bacterium]
MNKLLLLLTSLSFTISANLFGQTEVAVDTIINQIPTWTKEKRSHPLKKMTTAEKDSLYAAARSCAQLKDDDGKIAELIAQGLEVNRKDEYGYSLCQRAIFGAVNYSALFALWEAKASAPTAYIENIFDQFEKGKTASDLYQAEKEAKDEKHRKVPDLTSNFSIQKLKIASTFFEITEAIEDVQDSEIELTINLMPFLYDEHYTETTLQFLGFCNPALTRKIFSKEGYEFQEEEIDPASIYVENVHNLVELKKLVIKAEKDFYLIKADLLFDFEGERTSYKNQTIHWEFKTNKIAE